MSKRRFQVVLALCALFMLAAIPPFPGAMIGFGLGIAVAFFVAPLGFGVDALADRFDLPIDKTDFFKLLIAIYVLFVLVALGRAWRDHARGNMDMARKRGANAAILLSLAAGGWLSSQALVRAWPM